ncbi:MAG TPA: response regulator [Pseudomonadales bacterium]|nr:response regulator [Pseudomonadales bacterium]
MAKTIIESGEHIDLLFSDVLLPGEMDGIMLAVWAQEYFPQIKIVLTSEFIQGKANKNLGFKTHPFPSLRKPYKVDQLARQLKTALVK